MWIVAIIAGFAIMALSIPGYYSRQFWFVAPFSWFMLGLQKWIWLSRAVPMVPCILATKVPTRNLSRLLQLLARVAVIRVGIVPTVYPLAARGSVASLATPITNTGVCLQSTDFTCGPAAAVTALKKLGTDAQEGELALCFGTSPFTGTPDDIAADQLRKTCGSAGLVVEHRYMKSVDQFRDWPAAMAVVKQSPLFNDFVAVLEVTDEYVIEGDPLAGRVRMPRDKFEVAWCQLAISLRRDGAGLGSMSH